MTQELSALDQYDRALLKLIQTDASLSVAQLADKVHLSKSACWRRLQQLEHSGVIKAKVALLDPEKLNLPLTAYIVIRTNQHNDRWYQGFKSVVFGIAQVLEVYRMSGDLDYLVKAVVADMKGYDRLYKAIIQADLFDVSCSFVMETIKHTTQIPLDDAL